MKKNNNILLGLFLIVTGCTQGMVEKKIQFQLSDMQEGEKPIEISGKLALKSKIIMKMFEDWNIEDGPIPLKTVTKAEFERLKTGMQKMHNQDDLKKYLKTLKIPFLVKIIIDANYLMINKLFTISLKYFREKMQEPNNLEKYLKWVQKNQKAEKNKKENFSSDIRQLLLNDIAQDVKEHLLICSIQGRKRLSFRLLTKQKASIATFSPDNITLAIDEGNIIYLLDVRNRKELAKLIGHTDSIIAMAFSPDSKILATSSNDGTIRLWDVEQRKEIYSLHIKTMSNLKEDEYITSLAFSPRKFSPRGDILAGGTYGSSRLVKLWKFFPEHKDKLKEYKVLKGHTSWIPDVDFSPEGILASLGNDNTFRLWDIEKAKESLIVKGEVEWISNIMFNSDGTKLATGSAKRKVYIWDLETEKKFNLKGHKKNGVNQVAFGPYRNLLASTCKDRTIRLWDTRTKKLIKTIDLTTISKLYPKLKSSSIVFSPDGKILVSVLVSTKHNRRNVLVLLWHISGDRLLKIYDPIKKSTELSFEQALFLNLSLYYTKKGRDFYPAKKEILNQLYQTFDDQEKFDPEIKSLIDECMNIRSE